MSTEYLTVHQLQAGRDFETRKGKRSHQNLKVSTQEISLQRARAQFFGDTTPLCCPPTSFSRKSLVSLYSRVL